jgi:hypothetical protein
LIAIKATGSGMVGINCQKKGDLIT